ncbi:hypothetical protein KCU77_g11557, partial [Aureobasidium melanogenum]
MSFRADIPRSSAARSADAQNKAQHQHSSLLWMNAGSIDGDEYVRLVSLFKIKIDFWINKSFQQFNGNPGYNELKLVIPDAMPAPSRQPYEDFPEWKKGMADTEFPGQFLSKQAKSRKCEEPKSKDKPKSGSGSTSSGAKKPRGGGHGRGGGRGGKGSGGGGRGGGGSKGKGVGAK